MNRHLWSTRQALPAVASGWLRVQTWVRLFPKGALVGKDLIDVDAAKETDPVVPSADEQPPVPSADEQPPVPSADEDEPVPSGDDGPVATQ